MRLVAQVHVTMSGAVVRRDPTSWEKLKQRLGRTVDLETDRMRNELEAGAVIDDVRRALARLGVANALSLVIDDTVVFQDTDGKADDLPDLVLALSEHATLFGRGFRELRFAAEHEEAGLHLVIETRARSEHGRDEPAAEVSVGARLRELEPRPGESAESYQQRVEPLTKDTSRFATARLAFESFVGRLESALRATMPQARIAQKHAEARLVRQTPGQAPAPVPREPNHPAYDPFLRYYPSPVGMMLDMMLISSFMHAMHPPHDIFVTHPSGAAMGSVADVAAHPEALAAADTGHAGGHESSGDPGHDSGDASDGAFGDGGDFGDGDFGGGDFGD